MTRKAKRVSGFPQQYAVANDIGVGDTLTLIFSGRELVGRVAGLVKAGEYMICVRDASQLMPDFTTYGFAYVSPAMYQEQMGMEVFYPQLHIRSGLSKKELSERVNAALSSTVMLLGKEESTSYAGADGEVEEGKTMGTVLPVLFLLIAVLTMVTTMHRLAAKEKIQIGTLKALGFKNRRILLHYTSYACMIGIFGSAFGIGLGYGIAYLVMNPNGMMGTYMDLPRWRLCFPWFCWPVLGGMVLLLTLIGFLSVKQMLRGTAADALRPYVPKKVKPLLVEKTRLFHRLSFGVRWNLRDMMRHKSRMAMSLLGVAGGMILIVGSLGMRDTMDAFLQMYYEDATRYATRISLSEQATEEERATILAEYAGDCSASVGVDWEDSALSLDIYQITHDYVRFPGENGKMVSLEGKGAYICIRLAEEHGLQVGDTFRISPYGSSTIYTLQVAGIVRSVSKNIVITPEYADALGIAYTMDTVYTATPSTEIAASPAIGNVQSKQDIMQSFDSFLEIMNSMILILIVGALVLGVVVLYNLGVMSYAERYRELATLKVVGFPDRKIGRLLMGQNLWLGFLGVLIGLPAGVGVLNYLLKALAGEYEMKMALRPWSVLFSILITVGMCLLVSLLVARKNRKIDMVESLKGAE